MNDPVAPSSSPATDRPDKLERLRTVLVDRGAATMIITSPEMLAWLYDGARFHIGSNGAANAAAAISVDDDLLVCQNNERERMLGEQLPDGVAAMSVPWWQPVDSTLPPVDGINVLSEQHVVAPLRHVRACLLPLELDRYRRLCSDAARIATDVLFDASPEQSEHSVAGAVAHRLVEIGAEPLVVLVAGADRIHYRHPLPSATPLGDEVMVVICARRHGMIANVTRCRRFRAVPSDRDRQLLEVEADAFSATRPGERLGDVFSEICRAYPRHRFAADEWQHHHQGGPTGYFGRDPRVTGDVDDLVGIGQAFAWNMSATGIKIEDTVLTCESSDGVGIVPLTVDHRWPTVLHQGRHRPAVLAE